MAKKKSPPKPKSKPSVSQRQSDRMGQDNADEWASRHKMPKPAELKNKIVGFKCGGKVKKGKK